MRNILIAYLLVSYLFICCKTDSNNKKTFVEDKNDSLFVSDTLKKYNIIIDLPSDWIKQEVGGTTVVKMRCSEEYKYCANCNIYSVPMKDGFNVKNYVKEFTIQFENKFDSTKLVNIAEGRVKEYYTHILDYQVFTKRYNLGSTTIIMKLKDKLLIFDCMAINEPNGEFLKYRKYFEKIVLSIRTF